MVVLIIHQHRIIAVKQKCQAPVAVDRDCELPGEIACQSMQSPARHIHIISISCNIEARKLTTKPGRVMRLDTRSAAGLEKCLQPFVPEGLDHRRSV